MQRHVMYVVPYTTHILLTQGALQEQIPRNGRMKSSKNILCSCCIILMMPVLCHFLVAKNTAHLLGGPLESRHHGVLYFIQVLHSLAHINQEIGTSPFWTKAPDLPSLVCIETILIHKVASSLLGFLARCDLGLDTSKQRKINKRQTKPCTSQLSQLHCRCLREDRQAFAQL